MTACAAPERWAVVTENRDAVIAALARGQCDGLVPAAGRFMDDFAQFLHDQGVLAFFERFPDRRSRRHPSSKTAPCLPANCAT